MRRVLDRPARLVLPGGYAGESILADLQREYEELRAARGGMVARGWYGWAGELRRRRWFPPRRRRRRRRQRHPGLAGRPRGARGGAQGMTS